MNGRSAQWGVVVAALAVAACSGKDKPRLEAATAQDQIAIDSARLELEAFASPAELAGTTWRMVALRLPRGQALAPGRNEIYTIEFGADGRASVVGDCNRGTGTYQVTPPKGLRFGPLATTRAMCPARSLSTRFLGDFPHMEAYQLVGGHLYIGLADDAGIYDFALEEMGPASRTGVPVIFICKDSAGSRSRIEATFSGDSTAGTVTIARGAKQVVIPQVPSGSGARYEGSGVMFWNKGRDAMMTWHGANLSCASILG